MNIQWFLSGCNNKHLRSEHSTRTLCDFFIEKSFEKTGGATSRFDWKKCYLLTIWILLLGMQLGKERSRGKLWHDFDEKILIEKFIGLVAYAETLTRWITEQASLRRIFFFIRTTTSTCGFFLRSFQRYTLILRIHIRILIPIQRHVISYGFAWRMNNKPGEGRHFRSRDIRLSDLSALPSTFFSTYRESRTRKLFTWTIYLVYLII